MRELLYIDSCTRQAPASRSAVLGESFLSAYQSHHPDTKVSKVVLRELDLRPYTFDEVEERLKLLSTGAFNDPMFSLAREFASADIVVIAAPFWDCCFPAMLKVYFEHICVQNLTFGYQDAAQIGLCNASDLVYLTTSGGYYSFGSDKDMEIATPLIKAMAKMYGIEHTHFVFAEGLDIDGNDADAILAKAITQTETLVQKL